MKKEEMKKSVEAREPDVDIAVRPHCKMMVCENEKTGEIEIVYSKGCPKGYIEKIAGKIAVKGMRFRSENENEESITDD